MILPVSPGELAAMPYEEAVQVVMDCGYDREAAEFVVDVVIGEEQATAPVM